MGKRTNRAKVKRALKQARVRKEIGFGEHCPKCILPMTRYEHTDKWAPKSNQPYYFRYWDICKNPKCRHVQQYEEAKVNISWNELWE